MARYDFGGGVADFLVTTTGTGALMFQAATVTFWSAATGGTQYTDLLLSGSPVTSITVSSGGRVPRFQGPDAVDLMWADAGSSRVAMTTNVSLSATIAGVVSPTATPPTVTAGQTTPLWWSTRVKDMTVSPAASDRIPVLTTGNPQESSVYVDSTGKFHMIFTQSGAIRHSSCPAGSDPLVTANWSAPVAIIGNPAVATYTGNPGRSGVLVEGTTLYIYFGETSSATASNVYVATATATNPEADTAILGGATPTSLRTKLAGEDWFGNKCVFKDGATYRMFLDVLFQVAYHGVTTSDWFSTQSTSTTPTGAFTRQLFAGAPILQSLRPGDGAGDKGTGYVGQIVKEGTTYTAVFHGREHLGTSPDSIYRATTTDLATDSWTIDPEPLMRRAHRREIDQVADPSFVTTTSGVTYMFWEAYDNGSSVSQLMGTRMLPRLMRYDGANWVPATSPAPRASVLELPQTLDLGVPWLSYSAKAGVWAVDDTYSGRIYSNTVGDWLDFDVLLAPGQWTIRAGVVTGANSGQVTATITSSGSGPNQIFGLPAIGTVDAYAVATSPRGVLEFPVFNLYGSEPQRRRLRMTVATKNASATGNYIQFTGPVTLIRTAGA